MKSFWQGSGGQFFKSALRPPRGQRIKEESAKTTENDISQAGRKRRLKKAMPMLRCGCKQGLEQGIDGSDLLNKRFYRCITKVGDLFGEGEQLFFTGV